MADDTKVVAPLTEEQRQSRYAELRKRMSRSRIEVECPAGVSVRWVRKDDGVDISLHEWMGFRTVVEDPSLAPLRDMDKPGMASRRRFKTTIPCGADGTYVVGDVILMEIPTDDYEFFIAEGVKRSAEMVNAGKDSFVTEANKLEVPVFERDKAGNRIGR